MEPGFVQPRLQADEHDCQEKGAPPVAKSLGGTRKELENVGESGSVATSKVSAGPQARVAGEVGAPRPPSELQSKAARGATWKLARATRGDGGSEPKGRLGTPAVVTGRAAGKVGRRRAASEAKPETVEQKIRNSEAG